MSGKRPGDDFLEGSDFDFENPGNGSDSPRPPEGGDGTDFDFEMMPNPGGGADAPSPVRATVLPPPGDDDFEDETVDEFPVANPPPRVSRDDDFGGDDNDFGGFESDLEPETTRRASSRGAETDAFEDAPVEEQVEDVVEEDEVDGDQEVSAAGAGSPLVKYGIYGAIGLVGVAAIFYGWTSVLAPLLGMNAPIDQAPVIAQPVPIIDQQPVGSGQEPVIPGLGGTVPDQFAAQPSLPGSPDLAVSSNDGPALPGLPDAQEQVAPLGLGSETGLVPVQGDAPVGVEANLEGRVDELEKELEALSREDLIQKVASLEARVEAIEAQPVNAGTPQPSVTPPVKPQVIENWALRGYTNGVAWVEGPAGFLEVRIGSTIPDVGEVTNIQQYEGNWLVVTDAGLIMQTAQ